MASADVLMPSAMPEYHHGAEVVDDVMPTMPLKRHTFDANAHLAYKAPEKVIKMAEIGYTDDTGVSPVAVSVPFKLFSNEAVQIMRDEVFSDSVMQNHKFSSNIAACQIRGYSMQRAPFIHDAWHDPKLLSIMSEVAGVELVPVMDCEIGHVNISVKSKQQADEEIASINHQKKFFADDEGIGGCPWEDDKPIVGWHTDSYPFVCVVMLSDCKDMVGGETALRTASGDVIKVRGPEMGCAVVMQGRYITHQALRAFGAQERITMVTSFRPKSPFKADDSVLTTVRPISDLADLYYEFGEYRLEILEERIREELKRVRAKKRSGRGFNTSDFKKFLKVQQDFLQHTDKELVPNEDVTVGFIEEMDIPPAPPTTQ